MPATLWRHIFQQSWGLPWWLSGKESPADIGDAGSISGWKEPLEKEMATHSSILTCEPGRLQSMGSQKSDMTERLILPTHKLHFPSTPSFILSWVSSTNFFFPLMWVTFKVPIEPVTTLLLFYALTFWPQDMWDPSSLTKDWNCTPCTGKQSPNHWTAREVPVAPILIWSFFFFWCRFAHTG